MRLGFTTFTKAYFGAGLVSDRGSYLDRYHKRGVHGNSDYLD